MKLPRHLVLPLWLMAFAVSPPPAQALEIVIDYSYDTGNFFDTDEKKAAIEAVAQFYGDMIQDNLLEIDSSDFDTQFFNASWTPIIAHPSTGASLTLTENKVIPEDTIFVYVGARDLGGTTAGQAGPGGFTNASADSSVSTEWFARLRGRGSSEADSSNPSENTDFALWGGSISFDSPRTWNFSQSSNASGTEFIEIALHEMGHVLGLGTADSWDNLVDFNQFIFQGTNVVRSNEGVAPTADSAHFLGSLTSGLFGSFSVVHGATRPVLMLPGSTDTGSNFDVATDLDLAAMVDIGWELEPDLQFRATGLSPAGVTLQWNTVTFKQYAVERSIGLPSFATVRATADGDGTTDTYGDPSPPAGKAFYRVTSTDILASAVPAAETIVPVKTEGGSNQVDTASQDPVVVSCPAG